MQATTTRNPGDLQATVDRLGLTVTSIFVPWSQSRNKGKKQPSLNWQVTLQKGGRDILTTDYMAGSGHCPAYKAPAKGLHGMGGPNSLIRHEAINWECEHGRTARIGQGTGMTFGGAAIVPSLLDVIYSLVMDSDVLESVGFEDWASNYGYNVDSRQAEKTYRACLEIALKLRNGIGEAALAELREAFAEY